MCIIYMLRIIKILKENVDFYDFEIRFNDFYYSVKEDSYILFFFVLFEQLQFVFVFFYCKKYRVNIEIKCRKLINFVEF